MSDSRLRALQRLPDITPDLVLLDVMMPRTDGPTTLHRMRADPRFANIPVVFVTAKAMPAEVARFRELGAVAVIAKPFDPMQLGQQIVRLWEDSIMDERDELQQKIADIGGRYIQRTAGELAGLRELIAQVKAGNSAALKDIELLGHKIYGSGSMFGFEAVSEQARELEIAAKDTADPQIGDRLQTRADALEAQVHAALRARGAQ